MRTSILVALNVWFCCTGSPEPIPLPKDCPNLPACLSAADDHLLQGRGAQAERLYLLVADVADATGEPLQAARAYQRLGAIRRQQERFQEAEVYVRRSLSLGQKHGADPREIILSTAFLAAIRAEFSDYPEAEKLAILALDLAERRLRPNDPEIGAIQMILSGVYLHRGALAKAERLATQGLAVLGRTLAPGHADLLIFRQTLADVYMKQGRYTEAERIIRSILPGLEAARGAEDPDVARLRGRFLMTLYFSKKAVQAQAALPDALSGMERSLGPNHVHLVPILLTAARIHLEVRNFGDSVAMLRRAIRIVANNAPKGTGLLRDVLEESRLILHKAGRHRDSKALEREIESTYGKAWR